MTLFHHDWIRRLVTGLFLVVAGLVPLKTVFACAMMGQASERCCCEQFFKADCESLKTNSGDCCAAISLPELCAKGVPVSDQLLALPYPEGKLPLALPPGKVGPDPPQLITSRVGHFSSPPAWLQGTDTYLLTLRLRN
jgi:hypothetical protein